MTIITHVAPSFVSTAPKKHVGRPRHNHRAAVTSVHKTHTAPQARQQRNPQYNLEAASRTDLLVHTVLPFVVEIKKGGSSRMTTRRALVINQTMFAA